MLSLIFVLFYFFFQFKNAIICSSYIFFHLFMHSYTCFSIFIIFIILMIFFLLHIVRKRKLVELSEESIALGKANNFEIKGYKFSAKPESLRQARVVRVNILMLLFFMMIDEHI